MDFVPSAGTWARGRGLLQAGGYGSPAGAWLGDKAMAPDTTFHAPSGKGGGGVPGRPPEPGPAKAGAQSLSAGRALALRVSWAPVKELDLGEEGHPMALSYRQRAEPFYGVHGEPEAS